jgi:hypothetical protein
MLEFASNRLVPALRSSGAGRARSGRTWLGVERLESREVPATAVLCDDLVPVGAGGTGTPTEAKSAAPNLAGIDASVVDFVFATFAENDLAGNGGPAVGGE